MKDITQTEVKFYVATYEAVDNEPAISEVIAVFEEELGGSGNFSCYAHYGQHSICSQSFLRENCRKANKEEYQELFNELENVVGHNLKIVK